MKYKVGDKVKIIKSLYADSDTPHEGGKIYIGHIVTIIAVSPPSNSFPNGYYKVKENELGWRDAELEPVIDINKTFLDIDILLDKLTKKK